MTWTTSWNPKMFEISHGHLDPGARSFHASPSFCSLSLLFLRRRRYSMYSPSYTPRKKGDTEPRRVELATSTTGTVQPRGPGGTCLPCRYRYVLSLSSSSWKLTSRDSHSRCDGMMPACGNCVLLAFGAAGKSKKGATRGCEYEGLIP